MLGRKEKTIILTGVKGDLAQQVLRNINLLYIAFSLKAPLFKGGWGGSDPIKHTPQNKNSSPQGIFEHHREGVSPVRSRNIHTSNGGNSFTILTVSILTLTILLIKSTI